MENNSREKELKKIEDGLLKTRDGVIIMPGTRIFWDSYDIKSSTQGYEVSSINIFKKETADDFNGCVYVTISDEEVAAPDDFGLYSTAEALESSKL